MNGTKRRNSILLEVLGLAILSVIVAGFFLPTIGGGNREKARRVNCAGNMKSIGLACIIYAGDDVKEGNFPSGSDFALLNDQSYLVDGKVYVCPSADNPKTFASDSNYTYVGSGLVDTDPNPTTSILAYCDNHSNWVTILYVDGHVKGQKTLPPGVAPQAAGGAQ